MLASHLIIGAYGHWMPNDPRGSWSQFVGSWNLYQFGTATKTTVATYFDEAEDATLIAEAQRALKYPAVRFTGEQARAIGRGIGEQVQRSALTVFACAILPDHLHVVVKRCELHPDRILNLLKGAATRRLIAEGIHPMVGYPGVRGRPPKCFAQGGWKVYLDSEEEVRGAVEYVEMNPVKAGLKAQKWGFVTKLEGA